MNSLHFESVDELIKSIKSPIKSNDILDLNLIDEIKNLSELSLLQRDKYFESENNNFDKFLKEIPLEKLHFLESLEILTKLMNVCCEAKSHKDVVKKILLNWCSHDFDVDGVIGDLASNMMCSERNLSYLVSIFDTSTPVSILDTHIRTRYGTGMVFSFVAERILQAYEIENLDEEEWKCLIEAAEETKSGFEYDPKFIARQGYSLTKNNKDVLDFIESKMIEIVKKKKLCPIPSWINLKPSETKEKYIGRSVGDDQSNTEEELRILKNTLSTYTNKQKLADNDMGDIAPITSEEVAEIYMAVHNGMFKAEVGTDGGSISLNKEYENKDFPIERFYGPSNAIIGVNCPNNLNEIGPCRMFSCMCREFEQEEDEDLKINPGADIKYPFQNLEILYPDLEENLESEVLLEKPETSLEALLEKPLWFKGTCDVCHHKIRKVKYAIRFPIDGGGWLGCFCSFKCLRKTEIRPIYESDEFRISEIENVLNCYGVADI